MAVSRINLEILSVLLVKIYGQSCVTKMRNFASSLKFPVKFQVKFENCAELKPTSLVVIKMFTNATSNNSGQLSVIPLQLRKFIRSK